MEPTPELIIACAADLDAAAIAAVARGNARLMVDDELLKTIQARRERALGVLASGPPVYGVNTGLGAFSERRLDGEAQRSHQEALLLARAVGGPPWLARGEARAVLAARLRTFLNNDSAVSPQLCQRLAALLDGGVLPAVPREAMGVAGEIIALAHLAAPLTGHGQVLGATGGDAAASNGAGGTGPCRAAADPARAVADPAVGSTGAYRAVPAGPALRSAGIEPYRLGPKEGVALIEGVPVTTGLAVVCGHDAQAALRAAVLVLAAEFALTGASRDCLDSALARGDETLGEVTAELRTLCGTVREPRSLQPPVSFRVSAGVLAHLRRSLSQLGEAVTRALDGVTDSPAFLDEPAGGRFAGTAGFSGYDLASYLQLVTVALIGAAETAAARLHRLMDPHVSGLPEQLSPEPGRHTGLSPVHKRAVGVVHAMRRLALPATVGTVETSAGQEDVQSFSLEAAQACRDALTGLIDVIACEQLAIHQLRLLGARLPADAGGELTGLLDGLAAVLPGTAGDRRWGEDLTALRLRLVNWTRRSSGGDGYKRPAG